MCVITFEEQEGLFLALDNNSTRQKTLLGKKMVFERSQSPTNIIWENRINKTFWRNYAKASLAILLLLAVSFVIIYQMSSGKANFRQFFAQKDCEFVNEVYGDKLQKFAVQEYDIIHGQDDI